MNPELAHVAIALLTGFSLAVAALRYVIRAEFDRQLDRLDERYAAKEETERRLEHLEKRFS